MVNGSIEIANHYNQDRVAKVRVIKRLIDEYSIVIEVERIQAHKEISGTFQQVLGQYIIKRYNQRVKQIREIINEQSESNNT